MDRRLKIAIIVIVALPLLWFPGRGIALRVSAGPEPDAGVAVTVGARYKWSTYMHCGIRSVKFGGLGWEATNPVADDDPIWWGESHPGSIRMKSADRAEFTGINELTVHFVRGPEPSGCK